MGRVVELKKPPAGAVRLAEAGALWSMNQLARQFGMDRATVRRRLADLAPAATHAGHPVFALEDAVQRLFARSDAGADDLENLPTDPFKKKAAVQALHELADYRERMGELVAKAQVEQEMAGLVKRVSTFLDTLPDILEADAGLTPVQVEETIRVAERVRAELVAAIESDEDLDG